MHLLLFARIILSQIKVIHRVYDYNNRLIMASNTAGTDHPKLLSGFTLADTTYDKAKLFSQLNQKSVKWYSEMVESALFTGSVIKKLNFLFTPPLKM